MMWMFSGIVNQDTMQRTLFFVLAGILSFTTSAQNMHELHMNGEAFVPDTLYMLPGDSVHLVFDSIGHSMVQVPMGSWEQEIASPLIGFSMGAGTPNPGDLHTFVMDSLGTFYYLCEQHPDEKGLLMVGEEYTSLIEYDLPVIEVYPQPASDRIQMNFSVDFTTLRVSDHRGRVIRTFTFVLNGGYDVSELPTGMYFISAMDRAGSTVAHGKMLIER